MKCAAQDSLESCANTAGMQSTHMEYLICGLRNINC